MRERRNAKLPGWTLSETLVMMIVAGVVFLAVMDGMVLLGRYAGRRTAEITANMGLYEGYYLLQRLVASADSISAEESFGVPLPRGSSHLGLFREGRPVADIVSTADSLLIAGRGTRRDTLMSHVSELRLVDPAGRAIMAADTVRLSVHPPGGTSLTLSFAARSAVNNFVASDLREQEKQYAYE